MRVRRVLLVGPVVVIAITGCADDDKSDETLAPLVSPSTLAGAAAPDDSAGETFATPLSVEPTAPPIDASSSTLEPLPVADWDGAAFDVGRITGTTEVDDHPAILFDRYSYDDPQRGAVDATGFTDEPVQFWWVTEPYFNISSSVRRFVLAPDVRVLVLSDAGADRACVEPQPDPLPEPTWSPVETSFIASPNAATAFATLVYSDAGLVEQIRFTSGCP
jgi:hypothetical protein